jgi:hypothetical protein
MRKEVKSMCYTDRMESASSREHPSARRRRPSTRKKVVLTAAGKAEVEKAVREERRQQAALEKARRELYTREAAKAELRLRENAPRWMNGGCNDAQGNWHPHWCPSLQELQSAGYPFNRL